MRPTVELIAENARLVKALEEAQGKLEAVQELARQGQYVWSSALDRLLPKEGE